MKQLEVIDLSVAAEGQPILTGISLKFQTGKRYAILGPNGAGKSALVSALMSHPHYQITKGQIRLDGEDITSLATDAKARRGLFLGAQYPAEVEGVSFANFLRSALAQTRPDVKCYNILAELKKQAAQLGFSKFDPERDLNVGWSGGEKKKSEILQMLALRPSFAFLDEPDSGLDIDGVAALGTALKALDWAVGLVIITHQPRALQALQPDVVYILKNGHLVASGGAPLARQIQSNGFKGL